LSRQLFSYARIVLFVTLPVAIGLMLTADIIVGTLYGRGAFDQTAVALTSQALFFYAIGLPAHAMGRIFRSTFFGLKETWTPTKIALFCFASRIFLSWILIGHLAHRGIALADSIAQITNVVLLFYFLPREVRGKEGVPTLISFAQTMTGCMVMAAVVYLARENIDGLLSSPLELACMILLGAAVYGAVSFFFQKELTHPILRTFTELGAKYLPRTL
jgi:putative peptidoglycan lipid II flippase